MFDLKVKNNFFIARLALDFTTREVYILIV